MGATAISAVITVSFSLGLAILYGLVAIVWYELLRSAVLSLVARRRRHKARVAASREQRRAEAELAESGHGAPEQVAAEEAAADPARRHYHLARKAAEAERDAAVQAANEATEQAIERIERRYRAIDLALVHDHPARRAAEAERDVAVKAANEATEQAIERIERRYREIDWALEDEETERIQEVLRRPPSDNTA